MQDKINYIRAITRPIILCFLTLVSGIIIVLGLTGDLISSGFWVDWADKLLWLTLALDAEWVAERPIGKVLSGYRDALKG